MPLGLPQLRKLNKRDQLSALRRQLKRVLARRKQAEKIEDDDGFAAQSRQVRGLLAEIARIENAWGSST